MAANISTQPIPSLTDSRSPRMIHPARTEKQDSRLRSRDATVGFTFFCPTICRYTYRRREYSRIEQREPPARRPEMVGVSRANMGIREISPHTKNWIQDIFTPSTLGAK